MVMTVAEEKNRELDAKSSGSTVLASSISLALLLGQYAFLPLPIDDSYRLVHGTEGTLARAISLEINEIDLFKQINRIHDELLRNQRDLDVDSRRALYQNLWELYT